MANEIGYTYHYIPCALENNNFIADDSVIESIQQIIKSTQNTAQLNQNTFHPQGKPTL